MVHMMHIYVSCYMNKTLTLIVCPLRVLHKSAVYKWDYSILQKNPYNIHLVSSHQPHLTYYNTNYNCLHYYVQGSSADCFFEFQN